MLQPTTSFSVLRAYDLDPKNIAKQYTEVKGKRVRFCCCFCSRPCCITSTVLLVLFTVGLGLAVFFLFPRIPTFDVGEVTLASGNSLLPSLGGSITIKWNVPTKIYNPNYIDVHVESMNVKVFVKGTDSIVAQGIIENLVFKSQQYSNIIIPMSTKVSIGALTANHSALKNFITYCSTSPPGSTQTVSVVSDISVAIFSLSKQMTMEFDKELVCNTPKLSDIIRAYL